MPAAIGGTISSGTYYVEEVDLYQGSTGYTSADTSTEEYVFDMDRKTFLLLSTGPDPEIGGTISVSGSTITLNLMCPSSVNGGVLSLPYSVLNSGLTLFDTANSLAAILVKQ